MSGTFWDAQAEAPEPRGPRKPVWAWVIAAVDLLIVLAVVPVVILVVVPFFAVFYIFLAQLLVWISPVLLAANVVLFLWAFRHRYAGMTALAILSVLFVLLSALVLVLWGAPLTVFGLTNQP